MKAHHFFTGFTLLLLILYVVAETNKPQPINWSISLNKSDKNPYGTYIAYHSLSQLFPQAKITNAREPLYSRFHYDEDVNAACIVISPSLSADVLDVEEAYQFVASGNYCFIAAYDVSNQLLDTLGIKINNPYTTNNTAVAFTNPAFDTTHFYTAGKAITNDYFDSIAKPDSVIILGKNKLGKPNFIKVLVGDGAFFIHASPLCFTNYFMLQQNNAQYTTTALSYLPKNIETIYWDDYYKAGRSGPQTPLRFLLTNPWLKYVLWLSVIGLLVYVLFNLKRKQRIIPEIAVVKNDTLEFIKTIASVYFSRKDNTSIAQKKVQYWLEFVRQRFYLSTQYLNTDFAQALSKKSGAAEADIQQIIAYVAIIESGNINNRMLVQINAAIDHFYTSVQ